MIKFLPKSYLEDYNNYCYFLNSKKNWPVNPKVILLLIHIFVNDAFKIWLAKQRENKTKFIVGQHGSGYLFPKIFTAYDRM